MSKTDVIFAKTRHEYGSYADFWRLVELSGFTTCYVDEIDHNRDATYIFTPTNGETLNGWDTGRARVIWWDLEWRDVHTYDIPRGVSEVWASDPSYARDIGAKYVLLGSHPGLGCTDKLPLQSDVAALMYTGPHRRATLLNQLNDKGIRIGAPCWGDERDTLLRSTRAMLHIHQHDGIATIAPLRFALAAAYRLPVISEHVDDMGDYRYRCLWSTLPYYADFVKLWISSPDTEMLAGFGYSLHSWLCERQTFERCVYEAL